MPHMYNTPWQAPAPLVQNNPNVLGARGQASSIGNRYGRPELMPYAPLAFTAGIFSAQAKQELTAFIDTMLSIWPFDFSVHNGIVTLEVRHDRWGIPKDPRAKSLLVQHIADNPTSPLAVAAGNWITDNTVVGQPAPTAVDFIDYIFTTDQAGVDLLCGLGCAGYLIPNPIMAQHNDVDGTIDTRYGGHAMWWIDWDRITDITIIEKLYQMWYDFKQAIIAA